MYCWLMLTRFLTVGENEARCSGNLIRPCQLNFIYVICPAEVYVLARSWIHMKIPLVYSQPERHHCGMSRYSSTLLAMRRVWIGGRCPK